MKIGLEIKIEPLKLFLSRDFCMEKLLPREVTIFPGKKSLTILLKMHKTNAK